MKTSQVRYHLEVLVWKELKTLGVCDRRDEIEAALDGLAEAISGEHITLCSRCYGTGSVIASNEDEYMGPPLVACPKCNGGPDDCLTDSQLKELEHQEYPAWDQQQIEREEERQAIEGAP